MKEYQTTDFSFKFSLRSVACALCPPQFSEKKRFQGFRLTFTHDLLWEETFLGFQKKIHTKSARMLLQLPRLTSSLRDPFDVDQAYLQRKIILQNHHRPRK